MKKTKFYNWRDEIREVVDIPSSEPETDDESEKEIKEKKVKNKVIINPPMKEAIESLGGTIVEILEVDEEMTPDQMKSLKNKEMMMRKQHLLDKQRMQMQKQGKLSNNRMEESSKAYDLVKKMMKDKYGEKVFLTKDQMKASNRKPRPVKYTYGDMSKEKPRAGESD